MLTYSVFSVRSDLMKRLVALRKQYETRLRRVTDGMGLFSWTDFFNAACDDLERVEKKRAADQTRREKQKNGRR